MGIIRKLLLDSDLGISRGRFVGQMRVQSVVSVGFLYTLACLFEQEIKFILLYIVLHISKLRGFIQPCRNLARDWLYSIR